MFQMVILLIISIGIVGCGKSTKIEAHKSPSQFQGKTTTPEKTITKESETPHNAEIAEIKSVPTKIDSVEAIIDVTIREKVEKTLAKVDIKTFRLSKMLSKTMWDKSQKFSFEMIKCGVSYLGPLCVPNSVVTNHSSMSLYRYKNQHYFYVEFKSNESELPLAFLFHFEKIEPEITVKKIEVFSLVRPRTSTVEIPTYLADTTSALSWTELGPSKNTFESP